MVLVQTPLRISLFGGSSDYAEWFMHSPEGGAVLGMAINHYVYMAVQPMTLGSPLRYRIRYSLVDDCQTVDEIQHPAVKAALKYYGIDSPLLITCFGDLPGGAGLCRSSAFCVVILKAIQTHFNLPTTNSVLDLASEATSFERHIIPETVGFQDQVFAAVGGLNFLTFDRTGTTVQRLHIAEERLRELEQSLVLVYVGNTRNAYSMAKKQVSAIPQNHDLLLDLVEMARAGRDVLLNSIYPLYLLGGILHKAWKAKILLCPDVTNPNIDTLYEHGLRCGAVGGKLVGAGGGGFLLFFIPPENHINFKNKIGAPCVTLKISTTGSRVVSLNRESTNE